MEIGFIGIAHSEKSINLAIKYSLGWVYNNFHLSNEYALICMLAQIVN